MVFIHKIIRIKNSIYYTKQNHLYLSPDLHNSTHTIKAHRFPTTVSTPLQTTPRYTLTPH